MKRTARCKKKKKMQIHTVYNTNTYIKNKIDNSEIT